MFFDWTYLVLVMPAVIFALWASAKVNSTYNEYQNQLNSKNITAYQAARMVLDYNGLNEVKIERVNGNLTDHYDPKANVVRLSDSVYSSTSTAAIGIACHEVGHAIQFAEDYAPAKFRMAIVPITNIGSRLALPLILLGVVFSALSPFFSNLIYIGIGCFGLSTVFQLVTLPTEFDASNRAIYSIESNSILVGEEVYGAKKVLNAAALTYVAALAVSLMQFLRLLLIFGGRRRS
ncbi:MAG: zinc metallopeptidase [Clostridiales bacterium]|nr:zinc metallopeptidase [Clostridiales bacterium]